ncbi:uncharacterized protein LOC124924416 [Impatiens glandulifera]|uniref:uncharacterized protein LOC124924416 n=1 Tax=Impatiens glandulifera TaxID=253017 RepID=UPI001FB0B2EC|nr:uncharacterized protein LOC124924416 [Impatiens glandulifera]
MTREETDPKTTIITGNLLIENILANTLIATGETHSFIIACFFQKAGLKPEESLMTYSISLPSGSHLNSNKIIKVCPVYNHNHKMLVDLVVVDMVGIDVILGMDWLFRYEAQINCNKKTVVLTDQYGKTFLFRAILAFKGKQLFLKGAPMVMSNNYAMIVGQKLKLKDIEVVRDYPSVFPNDISSLPPKRDVEFSITLKSRRLSISKAPYRLAPTEMKELKD